MLLRHDGVFQLWGAALLDAVPLHLVLPQLAIWLLSDTL